ncbi:MAG TPA: hypothetical protein VKB47_07700 [Terracidiphilus sp.]|nr:hypothetical protein [Terracidiphilus sp.]
MRSRVLIALVAVAAGALAFGFTWVALRHRHPGGEIGDLSRTSPLNQPGGGDVPAEDYEPYSALYQQQPSDDPLVIGADSYTDIPQLNGSCLRPSSAAELQMAQSFEAANRQSHRWQRSFTITQPYQLLSRAEIAQVEHCLDIHGQEAGCANFKSVRHVRLLGIPGFDPTRTRALVSIIKEFGSGRGSGGIFEVEKSGGTWRRAKSSDFASNCSWMY